MTNLRSFALAILALPALAGEPVHSIEGQASLVSVAPETRRLVNGRALAGTSFGIAYRGPIRSGDLEHRIHLDLMGLRAAEVTGMDGAAPKHFCFGWDLLYPRGKWSAYFGLQGTRWKQSIDAQTGTEFRDYNEAGTVKYLNSGSGTKIGARLGLEYGLRGNLRLFAGYTQTEFNKKHNPGWFNLGVTYRGWTF